MSSVRIAKFIADAGLCSRRDAERMIEQGVVEVNGSTLTTPAFKVEQSDIVKVKGVVVKSCISQVRVWAFNKPTGCLTTNRDPQGRKTIFDYLPSSMPRVVTVGRLDYNTEGLLLLTTSGELARQLELPSSKVKRVYKVKLYGDVTREKLLSIVPQIKVKTMVYKVHDIKIISQQGSQIWVEITLLEGKNREIRNIFDYLGVRVSKLIRIEFAGVELKRLPWGEVREILGFTF